MYVILGGCIMYVYIYKVIGYVFVYKVKRKLCIKLCKSIVKRKVYVYSMEGLKELNFICFGV